MANPKSSRSIISVPINVLDHGKGLALPEYETGGSSGSDLRAAVQSPVEIVPSARELIPTGLEIELPTTHEAQIRPRSGLALKKGLTVLNSPGTIDPDYRGEIQVLLVNHGEETVQIDRGMRIAQMVIAPVARATWTGAELSVTDRGADGFGSTGAH
jgi:dUTP pyrophosphatase